MFHSYSYANSSLVKVGLVQPLLDDSLYLVNQYVAVASEAESWIKKKSIMSSTE